MSRAKVFSTLFQKKDSKIYEDAKQSAFKKWQKCENKIELTCFLIEELEASGVYVSEEVLQIFKDDFIDTLEKKFELFKDKLPHEMRCKNSERREWALKKLENIEAVEKDHMEKGKQSLLEHARHQVEKIYKDYEQKITDAFDNCTVSYQIPYHSFSEVVDEYPGFKGRKEDPLFNSYTDEYLSWYLDLRKEMRT